MNPIAVFRILCVFFLWVAATAWGQDSDINLPKQREAAIIEARALLERSPSVYDAKADPFVLVAPDVPVAQPGLEKAPEPAQHAFTDVELLKNIANQIPATGTAVFAGQYYLLIGQKRLKVGDRITISFQNENYDLELLGISSTNFSVKRGGVSFTRAIRVSN